MKKSFIGLVAAMAMVGTASAANLGSVGEKGVDVSYGYGYSWANGATLGHSQSVGAQLNLGDAGTVSADLSSSKAEFGVPFRNDSNSTFAVGYANELSIGWLDIVGAVALVKEFGVDGAKFETVNTVVEAQGPTFGSLRPFASWNLSTDFDNGLFGKTYTNSKSWSAGAYVGLTKNLDVKVGYTRAKDAGSVAHAATALVSYSF